MSKTLTPGQTLGKYRIDDILGAGNVGIVYKAYDPTIDRVVAVKTLHDELLSSDRGEEFKKRFIQEATAAARCQHPNILTIFEFAEDSGIPFIAMEYVEGEELKKFLKDFIRFKIQDIVVITQQILAGLKFAHSQNVIHRDIKPANILLLKRKQVKITDFGVAKIQAEIKTEKKSKKTRIIGTPNYMSPEQFKGKELDHRTDLYAVGLILFELLSRTKNLTGTEERPRGFHLRDQDNVKKDYLQRFIHKEFIDLIYIALQDNANKRFQSAAQFSTALLKSYKTYLLAHETIKNKPIGISASATPPVSASMVNTATEPQAAQPSSLGNNLQIAQQRVANTQQASIGQAGFTATTIAQEQTLIWPSEMIAQLDRSLAEYIGPFSKVLVKQYSQKYANIKNFIENLSQRIPDDHDRKNFISSATQICDGSVPEVTGDATHDSTQSGEASGDGTSIIFAAEVLKLAEAELAFYVGPIARALVIKTSTLATSRGDLYRKLASYIPDSIEKNQFLNSMPI